MNSTQFVNRGRELADFEARLKSHRSGPLAIFLVARSGIGKSRFIEEIANRLDAGGLVRVRVRRSSGSRYENGALISKIADALHSHADASGEFHTIAEFNRNIRDYLSVDQGVDVAGDVLQELKIPVFDQIRKLVERQLSIGRFRPGRLLKPNETLGIAYLKLYVRSVLARRPVWFSLENAHLIDEASLDFLLDELDWRPETIVILEHTTIDQPKGFQGWSVGELADDFERSGFSIELFPLLPLEYDHYAEVAHQRGVVADSKIAEAYKSEAGDIRALYHLPVMAERRDVSDLGMTSAEAAFEDLPSQQRFLLAALAVHEEAVPPDLSARFCQAADARIPSLSSHQSALDALIEIDFARRDEDGIETAHDTLSLAAQAPPYLAQRVLASELWIEIYEARDGLLDEDWRRLLEWYALVGEPRRLSTALHALRDQIARAQYKDRLINVLVRASELFVARFVADTRPTDRAAIEDLIDIWFSLEEYERALDLLTHFDAAAPRVTVLRAALLDRLDRSEEAFRSAMSWCAHWGSDHAANLPLTLVAIASLASLNRREEALDHFQEALEKTGVSQAPEYPTLLRLADIVLPLEDSIEFIRRSVDFFRRAGDSVEEGHSRNALGMQMARAGRLQEADREIQNAVELLTASTVEQAQALNNQAAIALWRGDASAATEMNLTLARDFARRPFDQIVIALNFALLSSLRPGRSVGKAYDHAAQLIGRSALPDRALWRTYYWNHAWAMRRAGNHQAANADIQRIRDLNLERRPGIWAVRIHGEQAGPSEKFQMERGYTAPFLSKWHFPISCRLSMVADAVSG